MVFAPVKFSWRTQPNNKKTKPDLLDGLLRNEKKIKGKRKFSENAFSYNLE